MHLPKNAHSYSMLMKGLQIAALFLAIFVLLFMSRKVYGHVEVHAEIGEHLDREIEYRNECREEKEYDRALNPDISSSDRQSRDNMIDAGARHS